MTSTSSLTDDRLQRMALDLLAVDGVEAVALGGSRARGTHTDSSDHDIGVYYRADVLQPADLGPLAERWADEPVPIAAPGQWGPWVDGGAWLRVDGGAVDWILRDVARVNEQCRRALEGRFAFHVQAGHPLGFLDIAYAGEVAHARPLADPDGVLADWKQRLDPYPDALRDALVENTWQVTFDLELAAKGADKADAAFVALCCVHAALLCAHGWHAKAGVWVVNEKGLVPAVHSLPVDTGTFSEDVAEVLAQPGSSPTQLCASVERLSTVLEESLRRLRAAA